MRMLSAIAGVQMHGAIGFLNSIKRQREGDSRFANVVTIAGVQMHGAIGFLSRYTKNSGWKQLVLAFILFSCYPKR